MIETFESTVLSMVHVALNQGRTSVEIATKRAHKTRMLLRLSQIVLAVDHGQYETATDQLAQLEGDIAERKPDVMEYRVLSVCRGMFDTAVGPGPEITEVGLAFMSRLFSCVHMGDFPSAKWALDNAISARGAK